MNRYVVGASNPLEMLKMKSIPIMTSLLGASLVGTLFWFSGWATFVWQMGTKALPDDVGFGYYQKFNAARKVLERSTCIESIEYSRHEDFTLEDFHFKVQTRSGKCIKLWFNDGMDVDQVCSNPVGFVVFNPTKPQIYQVYTLGEVSAILEGRDVYVQLLSLDDVLCNIDELARVFEINYRKEDVRSITNKDKTAKYLQVEIVDHEREGSFQYTRVR